MICPPEHKHGDTGTCYNSHKCRCEGCTRSRAEYQFYREKLLRMGKWDKTRSVDATGTRRRMQALSFMGWPSTVLGELLGTTQAQAHVLLTAAEVLPATVVRVQKAYDRVWSLVPPGGRRVYTMNRARRYGWVGPLAWDDDTIDNPDATPQVRPKSTFLDRLDDALVQAAISGEDVELSPLEVRAAVRRLWRDRWSDRLIATRLGYSDRQINRIRVELNLSAVPMEHQTNRRNAA